eukprot:scaffold165936_cov21-Tisochrysis_lutea.AAC.2
MHDVIAANACCAFVFCLCSNCTQPFSTPCFILQNTIRPKKRCNFATTRPPLSLDSPSSSSLASLLLPAAPLRLPAHASSSACTKRDHGCIRVACHVPGAVSHADWNAYPAHACGVRQGMGSLHLSLLA